jgi:hypothetical protein
MVNLLQVVAGGERRMRIVTDGAPVRCAEVDGSRDAEAVRSALARLCCSSILKSALKLQAFLRLIVESVLCGNASRLKAYTIGVDALGCAEDFDPTRDAIVRVHAKRLREALSQYYLGEGAADPLIIAMPRGTYVPKFKWRDTRGRSTTRYRAEHDLQGVP